MYQICQLMNNSYSIKPCLVETRQGFSVLYNEKPLYSKYAPKDSILKIVNNLEILPNTLILCFSPVLGYGLEELLAKLPENCFILALEKDKALYDFSLTESESLVKNAIQQKNAFLYLHTENPLQIAKLVNNYEIDSFQNIDFPKIATFKRVLPLDFSGGAKLNSDFYKETTSLLDESISQFWKNRTTLIKLGRLYAGNFFKNLSDIAQDKKSFSSINLFAEESRNKHILILGTGLSLDELLPALKKEIQGSNIREKLFIISVDASLPVVKKYGITPDLVVGVEGQFAIEKAYIGFNNSKIPFAADLLSRPSIKRILKGKTCFFLSKYTPEYFFDDFLNLAKQLNIPAIEPLGSVGLVAVELALIIREKCQKIFCCGTDFSFLPGKTHCNGAPVHTANLSSCNKLSSTEQFASSFSGSNFYISGKSSRRNPNAKELSSKNLYNYGLLFEKRYSSVNNLYDLSKFGVETGLPQISHEDFFETVKSQTAQIHADNETSKRTETVSPCEIAKIREFLTSHHSMLSEIKDILTGNKTATNLEILLNKCGYLYLHFPDGENGPKLTSDFLKRVRAEIEFFLKITKL